MRLVLGIQLTSKGAAITGDVERHREMTWSVRSKELQEHADEALGHVGGFVRDRARHRGADRVIRTKELRVAVDDVEGALGRLRRHGCMVVEQLQ